MNSIQKFFIEWAQDEFWIGHILAKKIYDYGPDLEENISIGSISQDEMGHCRLLLHTITQDEKEIDGYLLGMLPEEQRVSWLAESWHKNDWSHIVIKQLLYDFADHTRAQFCRNIPDQSIQNGLDMMEREDYVHREHWFEWAKILSESEIGKSKMQDAVDELYPLLPDFFATPLYTEIAKQINLNEIKPVELLNQTLDQLDKILSQLNLRIPVNRTEMEYRLENKGSRYGNHSSDFNRFFEEATEVYRKYPTVIWT